MPDLTVIAGCNGAGKSTFASSFLPEGVMSFDFDRLYLENYNSLFDCEIRSEMAINLTAKAFEERIKHVWKHNIDFCYETNFDEHPIYWPMLFKEKGYTLNLIFFCLDNIEIAKERIKVRAEFKRHFVDNETIEKKWKLGYKNLNLHYGLFDNILFVDNSKQNEIYTNLLQIVNGKPELMVEQLPDYFERRVPNIFEKIKEK